MYPVSAYARVLRFYAQLNDFLAPVRRGRRFVHVLRNVTSVKDAIEALGVPHPEVDVILPAEAGSRNCEARMVSSG